MKKQLTFIAGALLLISVCLESTAQSNIRLLPGEVRKMSNVELEKGGRVFLKSKLYNVRSDSLELLFNISENRDKNPLYLTKTYALEGIDVITIKRKKDKFKYGAIGGLVLGAASFFIVDAVTSNGDENSVKAALGQDPTDSNFEPIVAGITGFGLGILIGEVFSVKRLNFKKDRRRAYWKLKQYSYR